MKAEQVIKLIQTLEPAEIEKLFVLIKEYEAEVRRRQASIHRQEMGQNGKVDEKFKEIVDNVFTENKELFQRLAEYEAKEREALTK